MMRDDPGDLARRVRNLERRDPPLVAEFIDTAADPGDDLRVVARGWDEGEHTFGPVRWSPIGGALPEAGDEAVILERDDGVWQVVAWWSGSQSTGVAQSAVDAIVTPEAERLVGAGGQPAFANSWVNFDADRPAGFYRHLGRVYLCGAVASGTIGQAAFTLPAGYLPTSVNGKSRLFAVVSNDLFGAVTVMPNGNVVPAVGSNTYVALDGVSFRHA